MEAVSPPPVSETARERETFKYDDLAISTAGLLGPQPPRSIPFSSLSAAPDPGLTAFAQLGLYRLKAARALISLFDRRHQHIIAEALRASSAGPDGEPQQVWFNGLAFERATSICEHVVTGSAADQTVPGTVSGLTVTDIPVSIVPDLDADVRFCHIQDPARQFYAGVPIRSPLGINIGVYCVFDDKPRPQGLDCDEVLFIRDMSKVVMDYLESKRSQEWYRREQRMIRGLGRFVEGATSQRSGAGDASDRGTASRDLLDMTGPSLNKTTQRDAEAVAEVEQQPRQAPRLADGGGGGGAPADGQKSPRNRTKDRHSCPSGATTAIPSQAGMSAGGAVAMPAFSSSSSNKTQALPTDQLHTRVENVFSEAADMIRQATEVDGVVFMDSSIRSYGGLVGNITSIPNEAAQSSSPDFNSSDGSLRGTQTTDLPAAAQQTKCGVLGSSTAKESSFDGCKEHFLQRLLRRYPQGHVFNFDADGTVSDHSASSGADESLPRSSTRPSTIPHDSPPPRSDDAAAPKGPRKRLTMAARIIKMFPGARSVAVMPLWDPQTGRSFAAGFAWTLKPTRTLTRENELNYLRVFGLAVMAEVARLKIFAADKAKTDILGSISHELRSPLHGLVGTVELLRNTVLDGSQASILWTIETSARTLLDTIDHLLDFIKVNNLRSSRAGRKGGPAGQHRPANSAVPSTLSVLEPLSAVQLDLLVEEVVDSVVAGSAYLNLSDEHLQPPGYSAQSSHAAIRPISIHGDPPGRGSTPREPVQVYLDIDYHMNWSFRTHPGALRRIVMNLFGNSLKFTRSGFIRVSLRQEGHKQRQTTVDTTRVVLSVSDSGKGIGEDYLRNRLFIPFSQEDPFAPGTGLGLSLVKSMAAAVGGSVDVSSKVGQGTTITVMLPLPHVAEEAASNEETSFWQNTAPLQSRRVQLRGFERETRVRDTFRAEDAKQKPQLQLVEEVCRDVLGMEVLSDLDGESAPDFVISLGDAGIAEEAGTETFVPGCPHVFVCQDSILAHGIMSSKRHTSHVGYELLLQPIGPRKLARSLLASWSRWRRARGPVTESETKPGTDSKTSIEDATLTPDTSSFPRESLLLTGKARQKLATALAPSSRSADAKHSMPLTDRFPLQVPADIALQDGPSDGEPQTSILIVDDNAINLKILAAYLTKLKHQYTSAVNGLDALRLYTQNPRNYSCVLTDISMPVMDGLESTRRIREFERAGGYKPAVIISLTGLDSTDVEQNAIASGVDLFLTRPLGLRGLRAALVTTGLRSEV